jgi:DNA-binding transcriptional LysR family regulator
MVWDDLKIVLAVATHESLSAAARHLGSSQPTISRRLDAFEAQTGIRLFDRSPTGLLPTPLCRALLEGLNRIDEEVLGVERRLAARDTGLQGPVTVTSVDWLGDYVLAPILARFAVLHPLVDIQLINDGRHYNLSRREADLAVRFGSFSQEDLYERKVAEINYGLYVSPTYLAECGHPDFRHFMQRPSGCYSSGTSGKGDPRGMASTPRPGSATNPASQHHPGAEVRGRKRSCDSSASPRPSGRTAWSYTS